MQIQLNSKIDRVFFRDKEYFIKRDDLISKSFSGNKARKFFSLFKMDLKDKILISRGSIQSNAMFSLSVLAKAKGVEFIYYAHHLLPHLLKNPQGNLKEALKNGMKLRKKSFSSREEFFEFVKDEFKERALVIDEGGRDEIAREGIWLLAREIEHWAKKEPKFNKRVFLPSGTGTTALFLQEYFVKENIDIEVFTTPCVGSRDYLIEQFGYLIRDKKFYPKVLEPPKRYRFGKLYLEFYKVWLELQKQTQIEFDLLYDPLGWIIVDANQELFGNGSLYIHQGGVLGNETMVQRYQNKFKLGEEFDKDFR